MASGKNSAVIEPQLPIPKFFWQFCRLSSGLSMRGKEPALMSKQRAGTRGTWIRAANREKRWYFQAK